MKEIRVFGPPGTGKAQPLDSTVLTESGPRKIKDLSVGEYAIASSGEKTKITGIFPQGSKECYELIFSDRSKCVSTDDHLWRTKACTENRKWRTKTTKELRETLLDRQGGSNHQIPIAQPIQFGTQKLEVDPYILGVLLGDGCLTHQSGLCFSNPDAGIENELSRRLPNGYFVSSRSSDQKEKTIGCGRKGVHNPIKKELRRLGLLVHSHKKFIPSHFLIACQSDRVDLLHGLVDTDGYINKSAIEYSTSSAQLCEDVKFLAESLGGTVTVLDRIPKYRHKGEVRYGKKSYRLFIRLPESIAPCKLDRKLEAFTSTTPRRVLRTIESVGRKEAACISVDSEDGLYLTDNFIVTHNTRYLSEQVKKALQKYEPNQILVTSLTRTAAQEIAGRLKSRQEGTEFDPTKGFDVLGREQVGTLHSFCYRLCGKPDIADSQKLMVEWNRSCPPNYKQSASRNAFEALTDDESGDAHGDLLRQSVECYRAQMTPEDVWTGPCIDFYKLWCEFKADTNSMDFTDLIEFVLENRIPAPGNPAVILCDEVQDYSALELALIRMWFESPFVETAVLAGDDHQAIYEWRGATPDAFLTPEIPDDQKIILKQSYRLPRRVKAFAESFTRDLRKQQRKEFYARDAEGEFVTSKMTSSHSDRVVERVKRENGKSVMILASCGYMLNDIIRKMRSEGILFYNPYRPTNGAWNPLRGGVDRLQSFYRFDKDVFGKNARLWTWYELNQWVELLDAKKAKITRGAKSQIGQFARDRDTKTLQVDLSTVESIFESDGPIPWRKDPAQWLKERLLNRHEKKLEYGLNIVRKHGAKKLFESPKTVIGSVHSTKGAEADVVILFPNKSPSAEVQHHQDKDPFNRLMYVGATRAREKLILCSEN